MKELTEGTAAYMSAQLLKQLWENSDKSAEARVEWIMSVEAEFERVLKGSYRETYIAFVKLCGYNLP